MTALAADLDTQYKLGDVVDEPCGVDVIYQGGLVTIGTSGYAVAGQATAGHKFAGVAYEQIDNSAGSNGDENVRCWRRGLFRLALSGIAITDVGKPAFLSDDQTVTLTPTGPRIHVGTIRAYESGYAWIDIGAAFGSDPANEITIKTALTAATTTTGGDALNLLNPFGERVLVTQVVADITTEATGAATLDVGVAATGTSNDSIFDGLDVGTASGIFDNLEERQTYEQTIRAPLVAGTTTTGGDVLNLANPFSEDVIITRLVLDVTTPATGAATADAGVAATGTSNDTLIDGVDIGTAAILASNIDEAGTNGLSQLAWASGDFVTVTPSATAAGLVGNAYVTCIRPSAKVASGFGVAWGAAQYLTATPSATLAGLVGNLYITILLPTIR